MRLWVEVLALALVLVLALVLMLLVLIEVVVVVMVVMLILAVLLMLDNDNQMNQATNDMVLIPPWVLVLTKLMQTRVRARARGWFFLVMLQEACILLRCSWESW